MNEHLNLSNPPSTSLMNPPTVLLKQAWEIYKVNYKKLIEINLFPILGTIPLVILLIVFKFLNPANVAVITLFGVLGAAAVVFLIYLAVSAQAGFFQMVKNMNLGVMEAVNEGRKIFWVYFGLSLLVVVLVLLWTLCLIIPGIIFGVYYSLAVYVLVFEGLTGMAAIRRSKELIKSHWWAVVGRFLFIGIVIGLPIMLLGSFSSAMPRESIAFQLWDFIINIVSFIIAPLSSLYGVLVYKDLVRIKNNQVNQVNQSFYVQKEKSSLTQASSQSR